MRFIYIQCLVDLPFDPGDADDTPFFQHCFVEADSSRKAYGVGQEEFGPVADGRMMLNDYVAKITQEG